MLFWIRNQKEPAKNTPAAKKTGMFGSIFKK